MIRDLYAYIMLLAGVALVIAAEVAIADSLLQPPPREAFDCPYVSAVEWCSGRTV
jgi:hypothetical protein